MAERKRAMADEGPIHGRGLPDAAGHLGQEQPREERP